MKTTVWRAAVTALGVLVGVTAVPAQEKTHTETTTKQTGAGPNVKSKTEWVTGTVKDYDAGKKIKIEGPGGKDYSFDLDENARVQGTIVVGQPAKVGYSKGPDGVEKVSVISSASANAQGAMAAPRMHTESTTKESGPGPDAKTKKEVVIGTVKDFEPGKKIKVVGPGDKDFTFDLDEHASVEGSVSVGERVRVTYTKTPGGDKVTTVEPYRGRG
jgi:hypothetical protein